MAVKIAWEVRAEVYRLLGEGLSTIEAARSVGVAVTTVNNWANLAGMELCRGRQGGIEKPITEATPCRHGAYRRLTLASRAVIQAGLAMTPPLSIRAIARQLDVAPSTVSREVTANRVTHWRDLHYSAEVGHIHAINKRARHRACKLDDPTLRAEVVACLNRRFSPEQTAAWLRLAYPGNKERHVSHETIYQALYVQGKGSLREELKAVKALRSGRTKRVLRSKLPARRTRCWLDGARLSDRPAEVADRAVPGHWEGDLVVGPNNSGIITLVERQTRFTLMGRLPGMRDSDTVIDVLASMIETLPQTLIKSITWDQGMEMAHHAQFSVITGCPVFFCDPHSPWQRGTNENTNGLIRDFYPKGTDFNQISDAELVKTAHLLNTRPRETLDWQTPAAMLDALIQHVALAT